MEAAADLDRAAAKVAADIDVRGGGDFHLIRLHGDLAALGLGAGGDGAGNGRLARAGVDGHLGILEILRRHFRAGIHLHAKHVRIPAVVAECLLHGLDRPAVVHAALLAGGGNGNRHPSVTGLLQGDFRTCGQGHIAIPRLDAAAVVDGLTEQEDITLPGKNLAGIADHRFGLPLEGEGSAAHEAIIAEIEGGGEEAIGAHRPGRRDQNPVLIQESDAPVGKQLTGDFRRHAANHAVQHRRSGIRLDEIRALPGPDRKGIPIDDRAIRRRGDLECAARGIKPGTTCRDIASTGIRNSHGGHAVIKCEANPQAHLDTS